MTDKTETFQSNKPKNTRALQEQRERRRRTNDDPLDSIQLHLSSPKDQNDEQYVYYWANDDKGRIQQLTQFDDWDFVEDRNASEDGRNKDGSSKIKRAVGKARDGSVLYAYRLKKRRDWYEADLDEQNRKLDEKTNLLRRQQDDGSGGGIMTGDPKHAYVPSELTPLCRELGGNADALKADRSRRLIPSC